MNTQNNSNRKQNNIQRNIAQQQVTAPKLHLQKTLRNFMGQNSYTFEDDNSKTFWRDFCIKTYALLDRGSEKTQFRQKVAIAPQVQQTKGLNLSLESLHGEHSVRLASVMIGMGALYSSRPAIRIHVYALTMLDFPMPRVQSDMLNEIWI